MPLASVLVHVGIPLRETPEEAEYVEGEPAETTLIEGTAFDCFLIIPGSGEEENVPRGRRTVKRPALLYEPFDIEGGDLVLSSADQVKIIAEELTGPDPVTWQVEGDPTPLAKPGNLIGYEAALKRVDD